MRRLVAVAFLGLAVAAATDASAQGRPGGRGRAGVADTARMRVRDSIRVARGDSAFARRGTDSLRQGRLDGRGGRGPGGGAALMARRGGLMGIKLNDNEKAAVKTINEKYRAEFEQLREANKGAARGQNAELRNKVQAIADREQAEIRAALTAEHQGQFDANVAKRKERGANRPAGRRPPQPPTPGDR
jgi:hypothetical protein